MMDLSTERYDLFHYPRVRRVIYTQCTLGGPEGDNRGPFLLPGSRIYVSVAILSSLGMKLFDPSLSYDHLHWSPFRCR